MRVDWSAGRYETTASELEPVAALVVERAALRAGEHVLDVACGTGNAALLAAQRGAEVVGLDGAERLLVVARERAAAAELRAEFVAGDAQDLPFADASFDRVLSIFGVIFVQDAPRTLSEIARVLRPGGRALLTAWLDEGTIDAMVDVLGAAVARATGAGPPRRFAWGDPAAVTALAANAGLVTKHDRNALAVRADSPEAYLQAGELHPMALAMRPVLQGAGLAEQVAHEMLAVLRTGNEAPDRFLIHSPYVIYELTA